MDELLPPLKPITVRVREACRLTGIGRSKLYMLIAAGHIETVKVGSMTLIPVRSLEAFLFGGTRAGPSPQPVSIHANPEDWDEDGRRCPPEF
jgi:excisionase family DNA binding protein